MEYHHFYRRLFVMTVLLAGFHSIRAEARIWISRSVAPVDIYHESAPANNQATVTLTGWASNDSVLIGAPMDILFACDLSGSMSQTDGTTYRRITWAQIAARRFIDSMNVGYDKVAIFGWTGRTQDLSFSDTSDADEYYATWFPLSSDYAAARHFVAESLYLDSNQARYIDYQGTRLYYHNLIQGNTYMRYTPLNISTAVGLNHLVAHGTSDNRVMILLTDGANNDAVSDNATYRFVDSIFTNFNIRTYVIGTGEANMDHLGMIAQNGGGKAYLANSSQLDSIFDIIQMELTDVIAAQIAPGAPMLVEVLAPGIHFVPGSYAPNLGAGFIAPSGFSVDTVAGLTRLNFSLDTVKMGEFFQVQYNITAAVEIPDSVTAVITRTNNIKNDDSVHYSLLQYKTAGDSVVTRTIGKNLIRVRSVSATLRLSLSPDTLIPPSALKVIPLPFTSGHSAVYPSQTLYALMELDLGGVYQYRPVTATWNFNPVTGWTAPSFSDVQAESQRVAITVPNGAPGLCTLSIALPFQGEMLTDYLIFSAYDSATVVERVVSIVVDDDTINADFLSPRFVISGNRAQLDAFSGDLFARAITNLGRVLPVSPTWSASGFNLYQSQFTTLFSGRHAERTLAFAVDDTTFSQSDSGTIRVDSGGLSFSFELIILDTTDYDTMNAVVIYDSLYGGNRDSISAHYYDQSRQTDYVFTLRDSAVFFAMGFDLSGARAEYIGMAGASWQLNDSPPVLSPYFGYRGRTPLQNDRLIVTYTNAWGTVARDTITIRWAFGDLRYLSLESRPGRVGDTASYPAATIIVPANADTVFGVYAVVRDEYGFCVYSGDETGVSRYAAWSAGSAALTYVDVPRDTTSMGWVHRKSTPASEMTFYLRATGTDFEGLLGQKDSVQIRLVTYFIDGIKIVATASGSAIRDTTGHVYAAGADIPASALLDLTALEDSVTFKALVRRSDTQQWMETPVEWLLTDFSCVGESAFPDAPTVTLAPTSETARDTLVATYRVNNTILSDTVRFLVTPSWIDTIIILWDTTALTAGDTLSFTILAIDGDGDTVRLTSRLPSGFRITTDLLIQLISGTDTVWLDDSTYLVADPFTGGISSNRVVVYEAGTNEIHIEIAYPTRTGTTVLTQTLRFTVLTGRPDSMTVVRPGGTRAVTVDTLTTSGGAGSPVTWWEIRLYDAYGNLIPANSPLYDSVHIAVTGGALNASGFTQDSNLIGYDNTGLLQGGRSTVTLTFYGDNGPIVYTFDLVVLSLARLMSVSTHEWISDTVGDVRGYKTFRDGFLDYLDLSFSIPVWLKADFITSIRFRTDEDSVVWSLAASGLMVEMEPLDAPSRDSLHARYRLWLLSNALQRKEPLETGFLPVITISNALIRQGSASEPVLVGDGADEYACPDSLVLDSAPPVISRFLFKDNGCQVEKTPNIITIFFSEPVRNTAFPTNDNLTALALLYRGRADSTFMAKSILSGNRSNRVGNAMEAWNYLGSTDQMMAYEARVNADSNRVFTPEFTRIRFAVSPANRQVLDLAGHSGCRSASRAVTMKAERDNSDFVCSVNGLTSVSRLDAMNFSWGPGPLFPFFGFTVNLQSLTALMQGGGITISHVTVDGRDYVVCDYDTAYVLVESQVIVYDLLGNLTASPASHEALHQEYPFSVIRRALGLDEVRENLETMTLSEVEEYYYLTEAVSPGAPDTLRPVYPQTFTLGYDYLKEICGPGASTPVCVPAWNCLNAKGRLVAPGGYVIVQSMRTGNAVSEVTRKLIITDTKR